ncbi:MAG: stage III sporulation protein AE [Oscillospiraceae bacterium]|nr:stage III sporulation protein AE [Oscillospiraceae bacterium]
MKILKKLKKYAVFIILFILLNIMSMNVCANYNVHNPFPNPANPDAPQDTTVDLMNEIYGAVNGNDVKNNMPDAAKEYLSDTGNTDSTDIADGANQNANLNIDNITNKFSFGFIFNVIMSLLGGLLSVTVKNFIPVIAVIILGSVVGIVKNLHESENFSDILNFVLVICLAGVIFYNVRECFYTAQKFLEDIHGYMMTMIPVMASLSTISGNIATAAVNSAGLYVVLNVIDAIGANVILPVLQVCFALALAQNLTESANTVNLSGISSYIRSVLNWIFIFIMTVLITILFFQNILASSADTVAARSVKFAVSSFVPVVGSIIGDASRTIIGSIQAVKSVTGIFGVLVIIVTLLPPLITVILNKLMLKLSGAFALILGMDKASNFLKEMNSLLDITLAIMISTAVVFIFNITIFIKTAAG